MRSLCKLLKENDLVIVKQLPFRGVQVYDFVLNTLAIVYYDYNFTTEKYSIVRYQPIYKDTANVNV